MNKNDEKNIDLVKIGNRIQQCRANAKMTQEEVAEIMGISQKHLSRIEKGYHNPHFDMIISLAKVLNVPIDAFVEDFADDNTNIFLRLISEDIQGMSRQQIEMLRENIATIKKYNF